MRSPAAPSESDITLAQLILGEPAAKPSMCPDPEWRRYAFFQAIRDALAIAQRLDAVSILVGETLTTGAMELTLYWNYGGEALLLCATHMKDSRGYAAHAAAFLKEHGVEGASVPVLKKALGGWDASQARAGRTRRSPECRQANWTPLPSSASRGDIVEMALGRAVNAAMVFVAADRQHTALCNGSMPKPVRRRRA